MSKEMRLWPRMIVMLCLPLLLILCGCARAKISFLNDSDKIFSGEQTVQPPVLPYSWVCMSKGKYRVITTTANPQ